MMNKISCNVVKDLLPLYIDGAVSEETKIEIEKHLSECAECHNEYMMLKKEVVLPANPDLHSESANALKIMKHKLTKKKIIISTVSVLVTLTIVVAAYFVVTEVGPVHNYVYPELHAVVNNISSDDWQPVMLYRDSAGSETMSTFVFDSAFYNKEIVNHANSDSEVMIRVFDVNGNIVIDNLEVQPGQSASLDQLDDKIEYRIEAKITGNKVFLNIF